VRSFKIGAVGIDFVSAHLAMVDEDEREKNRKLEGIK